MNKIKVVTAYVPLSVKHLTRDTYMDYGKRLAEACGGDLIFRNGFPLDKCWSYEMCKDLPPAAPVPADRYDSPQVNVMSNIVQHTRTQWALDAMADYAPDVVVWLDLAVMKQGAWRNNQLNEQHVRDFLVKVRNMDTSVVPFPGIGPKAPINDFGNNWRFCGSTHIWPTRFLPAIDAAYREELTKFVKRTGRCPLDLVIWPAVEQHADIPFRWYEAEYDASQLTNFPGG